MILRRFTEHIRTQNWFAVILDFAVVVVGIYIGLQAEAWRVGIVERDLERQYLERLLADMDESIIALQETIDTFDQSNIAIDYIASYLHAGSFEGADHEMLTLSINSIGWVAPPTTNMVTIRELQSTGNISLIRDLEVRTAIGRFERSFADAEFSATQNVEFMATGSSEVMTWTYFKPRTPGHHESVGTLEDSSFGYDLEFDFERMLDNPDAGRIASWLAGWGKYHSAVLVDHLDDTIEFRDLLRQKLQN